MSAEGCISCVIILTEIPFYGLTLPSAPSAPLCPASACVSMGGKEGGREGLVVFRLALLDYSSVHLADTSEMA